MALQRKVWSWITRPSVQKTALRSLLPAIQERHITIQELDEKRKGRERVVILGSGNIAQFYAPNIAHLLRLVWLHSIA